MIEHIEHIVKEYNTLIEFCEKSGFDLSEYYEEWKAKTSQEFAQKIQKDLMEMCEDNEVMRECIREYFSNI
jgi:hypothetical protein